MKYVIFILMKSKPEVEKRILIFLFEHGYIGKHHTPKENVCHKLSNYSCKEVYKSLKKLYKEHYIGIHVTHHGNDVYLVPSHLKEIKKLIKE